jgi:hypothetical protein
MIAADTTLTAYFRDLNVVYFRGELPVDALVAVLPVIDHPEIMGHCSHLLRTGQYIIELKRSLVEGYEGLSTIGVLLHEMTHVAVGVERKRRSRFHRFRRAPAEHGWHFHKYLRRLYQRGAPLERRDIAYARLEPVEALDWIW